MRGGGNKKSIEQHIQDGTYRADRHGLLSEEDHVVLAKMKFALYKKFSKLDRILNETEVKDISKETINYYLAVIKTFDSISKNPSQNKEMKSDKMEL
jgi:hypothetical protein